MKHDDLLKYVGELESHYVDEHALVHTDELKQLAADYRRAIEVISHYADKENWSCGECTGPDRIPHMHDRNLYKTASGLGHYKAAEFLKSIGEGE